MPAALNAANEVAVSHFLAGKIPFGKISEAVCETVAMMSDASRVHDLEGILQVDRQARELAEKKLTAR